MKDFKNWLKMIYVALSFAVFLLGIGVGFFWTFALPFYQSQPSVMANMFSLVSFLLLFGIALNKSVDLFIKNDKSFERFCRERRCA